MSCLCFPFHRASQPSLNDQIAQLASVDECAAVVNALLTYCEAQKAPLQLSHKHFFTLAKAIGDFSTEHDLLCREIQKSYQLAIQTLFKKDLLPFLNREEDKAVADSMLCEPLLNILSIKADDIAQEHFATLTASIITSRHFPKMSVPKTLRHITLFYDYLDYRGLKRPEDKELLENAKKAARKQLTLSIETEGTGAARGSPFFGRLSRTIAYLFSPTSSTHSTAQTPVSPPPSRWSRFSLFILGLSSPQPAIPSPRSPKPPSPSSPNILRLSALGSEHLEKTGSAH